MLYKKLGNTGFDVSSLGFGMWQLGGGRWQKTDEQVAIRLLRDSHSMGINIFDSAVVYGQYVNNLGSYSSYSLELLGKAFSKNRAEVIYCIKLGQFDEYSHRADFTPHRIIEQFTCALKQLKTDYIDICLIHAPSLAEVESKRALSVVATLQALGIVRAIGYSFENEPKHLKMALSQSIDVAMFQYNLIDYDCAELLSEAERRGVGLLAGGPFKRGYLTGQFQTIDELPLSDDYWKWNSEKNPGKVNSILERVKFETVRYGSPRKLREAALQFILKEPSIASAVVGHRSLQEVKENLESVLGARVLFGSEGTVESSDMFAVANL